MATAEREREEEEDEIEENWQCYLISCGNATLTALYKK